MILSLLKENKIFTLVDLGLLHMVSESESNNTWAYLGSTWIRKKKMLRLTNEMTFVDAWKWWTGRNELGNICVGVLNSRKGGYSIDHKEIVTGNLGIETLKGLQVL